MIVTRTKNGVSILALAEDRGRGTDAKSAMKLWVESDIREADLQMAHANAYPQGSKEREVYLTRARVLLNEAAARNKRIDGPMSRDVFG